MSRSGASLSPGFNVPDAMLCLMWLATCSKARSEGAGNLVAAIFSEVCAMYNKIGSVITDSTVTVFDLGYSKS
jgi:hypothetical protein